MMTAVIKIQCVYRSKVARDKCSGKRSEKAKETRWYSCDDGEGNVNYYCTETGECVSEKPADFDGEGGKAPDALQKMMKKPFEVGILLFNFPPNTRSKAKKLCACEYVMQPISFGISAPTSRGTN
jgi:hypothetical protein